jgi:hypothetical protein
LLIIHLAGELPPTAGPFPAPTATLLRRVQYRN